MKFNSLKIITCLFIFSIIGGFVFAEREIPKEAIVFRATRDAVFTVYGDTGHGSGFLIDKVGLVLTNSHVITSSSYISVQVNHSIRVQAILLAEDKLRDIAVLYVNPKVIEGLPILQIAERPTNDLAFEGEKVICIGSPLNQIRIVTSGIVSKMEERAIISDVNINPGNSGGPMINMDSEVIAINTFRDPSLGGAGISGSIPITIAQSVISEARSRMKDSETPDPTRLPVVPSDAYPVEGLKWVAERSGKTVNYFMESQGFNIRVSTPPREYYLQIISTKRLVQKRRDRQKSAGIPQLELYDPVGSRLHEWREYVGAYMPLVMINVEPKIGETGGSLFLNTLGAAAAGYSGTPYYGHHTYEFKSDLRDFELMADNSTISTVFRVLGIMPVSVSTRFQKMEDIAQRGVFAFRPEVFNKSSHLYMKIHDLKNPSKIIKIPFPLAWREQILADFEPYFDMIGAKNDKLLLPKN